MCRLNSLCNCSASRTSASGRKRRIQEFCTYAAVFKTCLCQIEETTFKQRTAIRHIQRLQSPGNPPAVTSSTAANPPKRTADSHHAVSASQRSHPVKPKPHPTRPTSPTTPRRFSLPSQPVRVGTNQKHIAANHPKV